MFKVLTRCIDTWDDCWTVEDEDGNVTPQRFPTREEAQSEIDEVLDAMPDMTQDDFKIEAAD